MEMTKKSLVNLDWQQLLAFDQVAAEHDSRKADTLNSKVGGKPPSDGVAAKIGAKIGDKAGLKISDRIGAKIGDKVGVKEPSRK
jgi:hypothetical protein